MNAIEAVEADLQHLPERLHAKSTDAVHDLLLHLGDLTRDEIAARTVEGVAGPAIGALLGARRAIELTIAGDPRLVAVEYAVPTSLAATAPEGFTGDSDHWHRNEEFSLWTLHAWVWYPNPDGVFSELNFRVP